MLITSVIVRIEQRKEKKMCIRDRILIIAAGSIYGKSESGHKEGEPDVVGTFSVNRDENLTVVANRKNIEDREAFARRCV